MGARSSRAEVRNPVLALPAVARLRALSPEARLALLSVLLDIQSEARLRAERSWQSRKPPVAAYWAACGVYAGHIARAIGPGARASARLTARKRRGGRGGASGRAL
ncbi:MULTISPECIES: hypothetical protein [Sphingomonadaceae]|jgi:hypothetical protein|uniref:Uncharacterized protein n=1 Tax=Sphingobium cloacae TaxID=120107 RepID=A0A1E1F890_9SPHN|nr:MULTISPECIES: hypothetical protein [Sphingomonadaceae]BAV66651.1 hypothetical protein SCLO_2003180 [Sphingobium cloacae]